MRKFLLFLLIAMFFSCSKDSNSSSNTPTPTEITAFTYKVEEQELIRFINEYRVSQGKPTFILVNHLSYKSQEHNLYMIAQNNTSHDNAQDRMNNVFAIFNASRYAENIASGFLTPQQVLDGWLNSPSHKINLDSDFTHFGLAINTSTATGRIYYTNLFMKI